MRKNENSLMCEIHNSPIGAVCSDFSCKEPPFIMCIKCVVDPNSCIKKYNHKLCSLNEFFENISNDQDLNDIREVIQLYRQTQGINFNNVEEIIRKHSDNEESMFKDLTNILKEHLEVLFNKEINKIREVEILNLKEMDRSNKIMCQVQSDFSVYLEEISVVKYNFSNFCNNLLVEHKLNEKTPEEILENVKEFISNFKLLLTESNNEKVFNALDNIHTLADLSSKPINRYKAEMEVSCDTNLNELTKDLNLYFENKEREINEIIGKTLNKRRITDFSIGVSKNKSNPKRLSSDSSNSSSLFFAKGKKVKKAEVKDQSSAKKFSLFSKSTDTLIPQELEFKSSIVNDEQVIIIDKFNAIAFSNKAGLYIYDFEKNKTIFAQKFLNGEECYQKKYIMNNLKDYVFAISSSKEIIRITLSDDEEGECSLKTFKFPEWENKEIPFIFDIYWQEEPLIGTMSQAPIIHFYVANSTTLHLWSMNEDKLQIMATIAIEKGSTSVGKLEFFEADFKKVTKQKVTETMSIEEFLISQSKKYLIHNSGDNITVYEVGFTFTPYQQIATSYYSNICSDFYLENLRSTNEAYLYSGWKNGSVFIHSLSSKTLIKEVRSFNILASPIYSLCFINEKTLLVGGDAIIFLVNHANEKAATPKWKDVSGKIISLKIFMNKKNEENFISVSANGSVYLWNNYKKK